MSDEKTIGTVTKVYKCWWIKVNQKPVRLHTLDGAAFPHIITIQYVVNGQTFTKKKFLHYNVPCPNVNSSIDVYYDKKNPKKIHINI